MHIPRLPDVVAAGRGRGRATPAVIAALVGSTVAALDVVAALNRWDRLDYGLDLGIYTEAVRHYAHGEMPWSLAKGAGGFNLLGDHFTPAVALIAPLYRIWPDARVLLLAQAMLVGLAAAGVTIVAVRRTGRAVGTALGLSFGFGWGTQELAMFEFHEVALALPLLVAAGRAYLARRWWAVVAWALPLLLVKEDSVFLLLGFGLALAAVRAWRPAAVLAVCGLAGFAATVLWLIPSLSWYGSWTYWSSAPTAEHSALGPLHTFGQAVGSGAAPVLVLMLLLPTLGLAARSPLGLAALPSLAVRLISPNETYWGLHYHYNATAAAILAMAGIDGWLRARRGANGRWWAGVFDTRRGRAGLACALVVPCLLLAWTGPLGRQLRQLGTPCPGCANARGVLARFPDGLGNPWDQSSVAAVDQLMPYLVDRMDVHQLKPGLVDTTGHRIFPRWIVGPCDRRHDPRLDTIPDPPDAFRDHYRSVLMVGGGSVEHPRCFYEIWRTDYSASVR